MITLEQPTKMTDWELPTRSLAGSKLIRDGNYRVYPDGRIYVRRPNGEERRLTFNRVTNKDGKHYYGSSSYVNGIANHRKRVMPARLVAEAFLPKPEEGVKQLMYLDENGLNIQANNLTWRKKDQERYSAPLKRMSYLKKCIGCDSGITSERQEEDFCAMCTLDLERWLRDQDQAVRYVEAGRFAERMGYPTRTVAMLYDYGKLMTLEEIGERFGVTRQRVEQVLKEALKRIDRKLGPKKPLPKKEGV